VRAGRFESGEQRLEAMLAAQPAPVLRAKISAAIADLHFAWSQDYSAHGQYERAVRLLEGALEIDRTDRPWQAAEDRNEIGRAWTALNEPERAVRPHQEALEIAQSGAVRNAPQPFSCVRAHERTPWIEADALDGLANAERALRLAGQGAGAAEESQSCRAALETPSPP
jgi:tetratricopeptide (TPR) repeat protein